MAIGGYNQGETCTRDAVQPRARHMPLVTVVVALAAGAVLGRYGRPESLSSCLGPTPTWFVCWWLASAVCWGLWWVAARRARRALAAWLLLAAVALAGAAWYEVRWDVFSLNEIGRFARANAEPVCVEAVAREAPDHLPAPRPTALRAIPVGERSRLDVELVGIRDGTQWRPVAGVCGLVVGGSVEGVHAGDRLRVFGQLRRSLPPASPGAFDFAAYHRAERRLVSLRSEDPQCITVLHPGNFLRPQRALDSLRQQGRQVIDRFVGRQRSGLAAAMLLGDRSGLPNEETADFMTTGTVHVLVVSGLHVGILAMGLYGLAWFGWLPRRFALATIVAVVAIYTLVVGAQPPVVRAAVLTTLMCVAAWSGRRPLSFNSLAAAALVILAVNPANLFRAGAQLSFLAVAAIMWWGGGERARRRRRRDPLEALIAATRPWPVRAARGLARWTVRLWLMVGVIWLVTLPLVLYQFHVVTPVAVLISPAVWVLVWATLWSGFALLACGWLITPLGVMLGSMCDWSLAGLERLVEWAGSVPAPAGHFWAPGPAWWWVAGFYLALLAVMLWGRRRVAPRWQLAALCVWILVGLAPPLLRATTRDQLDVAFVAVGHGTCVVIEGPQGETVLYDAGSIGSPQYVTQTIAGYLWHRGVWHVDAIVLSHADVDHYNAVPGLLERFGVGAVYVSPVMFDEYGDSADSPALAELRTAIDGAGVPVREVRAGDRLRTRGGVKLDVLHPPLLGAFSGDNADSVTLGVEYAGRRVLLPGDLEPPGLEYVLAESPLACDVVMAPHHGSRRSDPPGLAAWSTPRWVVVSGGEGSQVATVTRTYQQAGARVLHTRDVGTIEFSVAAGAASVRTFAK